MRARRVSRWLVPEVIQTSLMDCGPAALKSVLEGFGVEVSYEALRERCETDVDGTGIDALASLGHDLGLDTHEVLVPRDSFLLPEADCLPAIVVTRAGAGTLHFLVVWSVVGPWVQIMDPASGRSWVRKEAFLDRMPDVELPIGEERWRRWAGSEDALAPLRRKMRAVGIRDARAELVIAQALADESWRALGALDAAVRMVTALTAARALASGREAERLLVELVTAEAARRPGEGDVIPKRFWWATPSGAPGKLRLHGAVIVHFAARAGAREVERAPALRAPSSPRATSREAALPDAITEAMGAPRVAPLRMMLEIVRLDHPRALGLLVTAVLASAVVAGADALLFRGVLDVTQRLSLGYQRAGAVITLLAFALVALALEVFVVALVQRIGRGLELRLRVGLLEKLPRLEDRYLRSRPTSDMASRGHMMHMLREAPAVASRLVRALSGLVVTTLGIVWIDPAGWWLAVAASAAAVVLSHAVKRPLAESSLRMRTHASALERFYLDALLGVTPIRAHGAERAVRREHESLLVEWAGSARAMHAQSSGLQALHLFASTCLVVALVAGYVARGGATAALLLLAFWTLRLPALGQELTLSLVALRDLRTIALRLFAPLGAAELGAGAAAAPVRALDVARPVAGVHVALRDVTTRAGGNVILRGVSLDLPPGAHVGVVGASGAGKSSLVGLLLGWSKPAEGSVSIDGAPHDAASIVRLRAETAWVDPAVHLFHRSLFENVAFGATGAGALERLPEVLEDADLMEVLEGLPDGMQGDLGEGGVRLSGGQGQRVRLARALLRRESRLVLLDEPFRGLERERRRELLRRARARWTGATLMLVTHDVGDTLGLDRVLVMDGGAVVEEGDPRVLMARPSRYRDLVLADRALRSEAWSPARFRRLAMHEGRVCAEACADSAHEVVGETEDAAEDVLGAEDERSVA